MSIQRLHIEGFKSLKNVTWEPGSLNVVIGPNGSGKSNLLSLLKFVRAMSVEGLSDYLSQHDYYTELLWDGQAREIAFDVIVSVYTGIMRYMLRVPIDLPVIGRDSIAERLEQLSEGQDIVSVPPKVYMYRDPQAASIRYPGSELQPIDKTTFPATETLLSLLKGPSVSNEIAWTNAIFSVWYIAEILDTSNKAPLRQPISVRYDLTLQADGQNLTSVLHTLYTANRDFKQQIDTAMIAAFGRDYRELIFPPAGSQKVELQVRWNSLQREQSSYGLSDGTLRFLFLITVLAHPNPPPLIAIDEPETGLHPRMLPIIAEYAAEASKKTQVIFTTHSPQFLDAFQDVKPTTTVATWEDGQTKLATLDGNELDYWLREYTLGSLFTSGELENMAANVREKQMQAQA